jgi:hypothetical protein
VPISAKAEIGSVAILEFKVQIRPPSEEWISSRESREVKPHQRPRGPAKTVVDRLGQTFKRKGRPMLFV